MATTDLLAAFLDKLPLLLTVLGALGLFHVIAAIGRQVWALAKSKAAASPNKIDDAIVAALDPEVNTLLDLVDKGDLQAIKAQADVVKANLPKK